MLYTATYSPEDNKLRLSASSRLDAETYARVKAAGFIWAPKQEVFVAPMWTPEREDLLLELAGEIDDEDTSLVERAEQRAERFEDYSDNRRADAEAAHKAVAAIADNIPLGQPILVGHHSEKHARRDAEKIENGMRRAVKMWDTAQYWQSRAAGAIRAAKYKELPAVRARRIKTLEADKRKYERNREESEKAIQIWAGITDTERALYISGNTHYASYETYSDLRAGKITGEEAARKVTDASRRYIERCDRWLQHINNRLEYERTMLAEAGGIVADQKKPEKGGACRCWASPFHRGGWSYIQRVNKVSVTVLDNWGNGGENFTRTIELDKLKGIMSAAEVEEARNAGRLVEDAAKTGFLLKDVPVEAPKPKPEPKPTEFDAMRETLKSGVQVVSTPQLFPTPAPLAARMVEVADIQDGHRVLEPSVGTGNIAREIFGAAPVRIVAVEVNRRILDGFEAQYRSWNNSRIETHCADFLTCNGDLGKFDRILMNPPFANGADIQHIKHAITFLKPGGRLVAICANGPRQQRELQPLADTWEPLPADTFKESGTGVNAVLLTVEAR
jgi:phospholipid N-methyltransferase